MYNGLQAIRQPGLWVFLFIRDHDTIVMALNGSLARFCASQGDAHALDGDDAGEAVYMGHAQGDYERLPNISFHSPHRRRDLTSQTHQTLHLLLRFPLCSALEQDG